MAATGTLTPESVLAAARATHAAMSDLLVEQLVQAVQWVALNPGEESDPDTEWAMRRLELAGAGAPVVEESAVAEFALAVRMKHEPGARLIGDAVELCHRLPRIWARVMAGEVPVWKARRVADATKPLSLDAAAAVDRHLAVIAERCSFAEIQRQVRPGSRRARPRGGRAAPDRGRGAGCVEVHYRGITPDGMVPITGYAGLADALAFDAWMTATAGTLDPAVPLDVRRSMALGLLGTDTGGGDGQRELVLYAHARPGEAMVEVENTRTVITPEQVRECASRPAPG